MTIVQFDNGPVLVEADERLAGMVPIPGGTFRMGSDRHYPEEAPVHRVTVDSFCIDRIPVTNRQFKEFVKATGHVTFAQIAPDRRIIPARCRICSMPAHSYSRRPHARSTCATGRMVDVHEGRRLAASLRTEEQHQQSGSSSGGPRLVRGCVGLCALGRQGPADRG